MAWDDILDGISSVGEGIGCTLGLGSITVCDATIVDTFETSTYNGLVKDGPWLHDVLFDTSTDGAQSTSADPEAITAGGILLSILGPSCSSSGEEPGGIIIFFKNGMPFQRIERRADAIYHTLHKKQHKNSQSPVLMATTKDAMDGVNKLFGNGSVGEMTETLSVLEGLLKKRKMQ